MGTRKGAGTRHFSRMINSSGIPKLILFISFIRNVAVRALIYTAAPVYFFDYIKSHPPNLHFFFRFPRSIRELVSFLSSMTKIDCLADSAEYDQFSHPMFHSFSSTYYLKQHMLSERKVFFVF